MSLTEAEFDARLARADRAAGLELDARVFDELARDLNQEIRGRRRRGRIAAFGAGGALLVAALAAPAAADGIRWLAQTGEYCSGTECGNGEEPVEFIDLSARDIGDYIAAVYPDYLVLPPGLSRTDLVASLTPGPDYFDDPNAPGVASEGTFIIGFEQLAHCGWIAEWLAADDAGDIARREVAAAAINPAVNLRYTSSHTDALGNVSDSVVAKAARDGERGGVEFGAWQSCGAEIDDATRDEWAYRISGVR